MVTQKRLKELYYYKNGNLLRTVKRGRHEKDTVAGSRHDKRGYFKLWVDGKFYYLHRLIYLYHHGYLPNEIDHIDRNPSNNKIENLRAVTRTVNNINQNIKSNNTSGVKGVSWNKLNKKWEVYIDLGGKRKHLGLHKDFEFAELLACEARDLYYKRSGYV